MATSATTHRHDHCEYLAVVDQQVMAMLNGLGDAHRRRLSPAVTEPVEPAAARERSKRELTEAARELGVRRQAHWRKDDLRAEVEAAERAQGRNR